MNFSHLIGRTIGGAKIVTVELQLNDLIAQGLTKEWQPAIPGALPTHRDKRSLRVPVSKLDWRKQTDKLRDMSDTETQKPSRERSKAYPGAPLEDCVRYTSQIKKELGRGSHDRESLAKAMGFGTVSGAVSPKIAALVHFGFLNRTAAGYELSDHSKSITDPIDERERAQAIRAAFSRPYLYQEVLSKFEVDGKIPSQLATHLHRFHGITDAASSSAAEIFVSSGRFAGVLDQDNNILKEAVAQKSEEAITVNDPDVPAIRALAAQPSVTPSPSVQRAPAPGLSNQQRFEFAITGGRTVVLTVPSDLNPKDIKVIRKQVELLELQVTLDDEVD